MGYRTIVLSGRKVDTALLEHGFAPECSMQNCVGHCCSSGVMADVRERDRILGFRESIKQLMDATQTTDESKWFEKTEEEDSDYPSGRAVGTEVWNGKCVFLNAEGRCTVQLAEEVEGLPRFSLKPFFCVLYPITIDDGVVTYDDYQERRACCHMSKQYTKSVIKVCRDELIHVLGEEGYRELAALAERWSSEAPGRLQESGKG